MASTMPASSSASENGSPINRASSRQGHTITRTVGRAHYLVSPRSRGCDPEDLCRVANLAHQRCGIISDVFDCKATVLMGHFLARHR